MTYSIEHIAQIIGATVVGNPEKLIFQVSSFEDATDENITFASDIKFLRRIEECCAGAVIVPESYDPAPNLSVDQNLLLCASPKLSFFKIVQLFNPAKPTQTGIHPSAVVEPDTGLGQLHSIGAHVSIEKNVQMGDNCSIMAGSFIGEDVVIGDNVTIKPNVTILEKTKIGNNVIIHSGTVIGSDGFGFAQSSDQHEKLIHTGFVQIQDNVEIGANCTIDRGTLGKTIIGNGVKIDNQVHLAHNVKVGDNTLIVAQVGIAGSTTVKNNVIIAGKAGISGHLTIGANSIVGPYAGVHSNVQENQVVSGIPQMPHAKWRKVVSIISRLPEMRKRLFSFEKRLKDIENKSL